MTEATWKVYDSIEREIKMDFEKILWENVDWIHVVVSCQQHNKLAGCVKCGKFLNN